LLIKFPTLTYTGSEAVTGGQAPSGRTHENRTRQKEESKMATKRLQTYKCGVCGNTVEVLHQSGGQLVCCNQPMGLLEENTVEAAIEKHIPVVEKTESGFKVSVGSVAHPMEASHLIEWIELIAGDAVYIQFLKPGQPAEATFQTTAGQATARAYCNLHGLWKS
jgi:superoxide reductase